MILAQKLDTGDVKYITLQKGDLDVVSHILKTFYSRPTRLDALLNLGNIYHLGASPFGKYRFKEYDPVNCIACIRDYRETRGRNVVQYSPFEKLISLGKPMFIYADGRWNYFDGKEFLPHLQFHQIQCKENTLKDLTLMTLSSQDTIETMSVSRFKSWKEIQAESNESGKPIFIFKNNKLVKTINHPSKN